MKLNYKRTLFVGLAFFLICTFWQAYDAIIPKILTDKFGLSQTASGIVMALDNILALFLLPLFGAISDRSNFKRGRRTPYIFIGTLIAAVLFVGLSFLDNVQLTKIADVAPARAEQALGKLYDEDLTFTTPEGEKVVLTEKFTREEYLAIPTYAEDGKTESTQYTNYVTPARQAYAWKLTKENPATLIFFMILLFFVLISMSTFRSPAVALMPDVTIKPLRSKANAIINLMGALGGTLVLAMGMIFATGKTENVIMSYIPYFSVIAGVMLVALVLFMWKVKEPQWAAEAEAENERLGLNVEKAAAEGEAKEPGKLSKPELRSLIFILASVVFWFMGYNAVTSKYSVYAGTVLGQDFNLTLIIANVAAIISYLPIGILSGKFGRKKMILAGILMLATSFFVASFLRVGTPPILMYLLFALAGVGWATISVNSYPMVVELSSHGNTGRYTGFYYTASMAAQTITPIFSGIFLDWKFTSLFPYAVIFVALSFITMLFVKHGDSKPQPPKDKLENFADLD